MRCFITSNGCEVALFQNVASRKGRLRSFGSTSADSSPTRGRSGLAHKRLAMAGWRWARAAQPPAVRYKDEPRTLPCAIVSRGRHCQSEGTISETADSTGATVRYEAQTLADGRSPRINVITFSFANEAPCAHSLR